MGRGSEPKRLREHQPQHRARLGIGGQRLCGRAVDQRIEIVQPAQALAGDGDGKPAVLTGQPAHRPTRLLQRLAPPQHRIEQTQRRRSRGHAGSGIGADVGARVEGYHPRGARLQVAGRQLRRASGKRTMRQ